jgi:hypothetical protein
LGRGGEHWNFMEHFLFLSVVNYWFEIAVKRRRECLAKTLFVYLIKSELSSFPP